MLMFCLIVTFNLASNSLYCISRLAVFCPLNFKKTLLNIILELPIWINIELLTFKI